MIITKMALPAGALPAGIGTTLALPLLDAMVPALSATVKSGGHADLPRRVRVHPERRRHERRRQRVAAERRRDELRVLPDSEAAHAVSRSAGRRQRAGADAGESRWRWQRRSPACERHLAERGASEEDRGRGHSAQVPRRIRSPPRSFGKDTVLPSLEMISSEIDLVLGGQCEAGTAART